MSLNINPVWLGVIMVKLVEVAALTPPIGMNAFVIKGIAPDVPIENIFAGASRFLLMNLIFFILLWFFPQIVPFLPNLM